MILNPISEKYAFPAITSITIAYFGEKLLICFIRNRDFTKHSIMNNETLNGKLLRGKHFLHSQKSKERGLESDKVHWNKCFRNLKHTAEKDYSLQSQIKSV